MDLGKPSQERLTLTPAAAAAEIARRALASAATHRRRIIIGIAGGPGTGKSTIAAETMAILNEQIERSAARVPMDGFHMRQKKLEAEGLVALKGAPQTFEPEDFIKCLGELKAARHDISMPGYSRRIEDVIPDAFMIFGNVPILVAEGNYLLLDTEPWDRIRPILDFSVFIDVDAEIVRARLLKRHAEHGLFTNERNLKHVETVDMENFRTVAKSRPNADLVIEIDTKG